MKPLSVPRLLLVIPLALLALAPNATHASAVEANAVTFTVNSVVDAPDVHPGDGICATSAGQCTLRAAVQEANAQPSGSSIGIALPTGAYTLTLGSLQLLTNTISISGAGAATTIVAGSGAGRVAFIGPRSVATLAGLTITGGNPGPNAYGGGVWSAGDLTLRNSVVRGNTAGVGGGITNSGGNLTVIRSRITGNTALYYGGGAIVNGGLHNLPGAVTIRDSTVDNNVGGGDGGAILNGQNGHPASGGESALAIVSSCAYIPLCAKSVSEALVPSLHSQVLPTYPLTLTVVNSRIVNNSGNNGGGGLANDGGTTVVRGSTITGNATPGAVGGGISSYGSLTVVDSTLSSNQAIYGGGVEAFNGGVAGNVTISNSTLSQNLAGTQFVQGVGGGIDDSATVVNVSGSTFSANVAGQGGGLEIEGSSSAALRNSTFSGNVGASGGGGGIQTFECGSATLSYVTFSGNSIALAPSCPDVTLIGSIVANSTGGPNCTGPITDSGYNLESSATCGFSQPTDLSNTDPMLGALANNGGPTPTMALLAGSLAIDAGGEPASGCPGTDQRGVTRPQGPACDIGAYELMP